MKWFGTARGRFGFLVNPQLLVFATGGFAYGDVALSSTTVATVTPGLIPTTMTRGGPATTFTTRFRENKMLMGYTIGSGAIFVFGIGPLRSWRISRPR